MKGSKTRPEPVSGQKVAAIHVSPIRSFTISWCQRMLCGYARASPFTTTPSTRSKSKRYAASSELAETMSGSVSAGIASGGRLANRRSRSRAHRLPSSASNGDSPQPAVTTAVESTNMKPSVPVFIIPHLRCVSAPAELSRSGPEVFPVGPPTSRSLSRRCLVASCLSTPGHDVDHTQPNGQCPSHPKRAAESWSPNLWVPVPLRARPFHQRHPRLWPM